MRGLTAVALGLAVLGGASVVTSAEPTRTELQQKLQELQNRLAALEAAQQTTGSSATDVDTTIQQVLDDAHRRSQLLQAEGFTGGFSRNKFTLQSADGAYSLSIGAQFQLRHVLNWQEEVPGGGSSTQDGFEMRRTKLDLNGNMFSPNTSYFFLWATSANNGNLFLEQAWVRHKLTDGLTLRAGQFIEPVYKEQLVSSRRMTANDRTLANSLITGSNEVTVQGLDLQYDRDAWRINLVFHDGIPGQNVPWISPAGTDFGLAGRVEYYAMGQRAQAVDFGAFDTKQDLLVFGLGGDWTQIGSTDVVRHTADVLYKPANISGLSLFVAYLANYTNAAGNDTYDWAAIAQVAYALDAQWEIFARGAVTIYDQNQVLPGGATEDTFPEITLGVNRFFRGHASKITLDITWLPNGSPSTQSGLGILAGDSDQISVRTQYQLLL